MYQDNLICIYKYKCIHDYNNLYEKLTSMMLTKISLIDLTVWFGISYFNKKLIQRLTLIILDQI